MAQALNTAANPEDLDQQTVKAKKVHFQQPLVLENKCVCQLCTCGKHRCPKPNVNGIYETTYKDHYKPYRTPKYSLSSIMDRNVPEQMHYNPTELISNYRADYVKQDLSRAANRSLVMETPIRAPSKFSGQSQYNLNYRRHLRVKTEASPPKMNQGAILPKSAIFIGSSNYMDSYQMKDMLPVKPIRQPYKLLPPLKFEGSTSYQQDYTALPIKSVNINIKDLYQQPRVSLPFRGQSTYKHYYVKPAVSAMNHESILVDTVKKQECICQHLPIPKINESQRQHLTYVKGKWV